MSEQANQTAPVTTQADPAVANTTTPAPEAKAADAGTKEVPAAKDAATETKTSEVKAVPEKYEFKLKEGSLLKQGEVDQTAATARELGLSNDAAQKLLDERGQAKAGFMEEQKSAFESLRSNWKETFTKDSEIGGEHAKASAENARRFVDKYATPEFKQVLNDTGFGDHPELIRIFARAGKSMAEDKVVMPGKQSGSDAIEAKNVLYPSHNKKQE